MLLKRYFTHLPVYFTVLLVLFAGAIFLLGLLIHEVLMEQDLATDDLIPDYFSHHIVSYGVECATPVEESLRGAM